MRERVWDASSAAQQCSFQAVCAAGPCGTSGTILLVRVVRACLLHAATAGTACCCCTCCKGSVTLILAFLRPVYSAVRQQCSQCLCFLAHPLAQPSVVHLPQLLASVMPGHLCNIPFLRTLTPSGGLCPPIWLPSQPGWQFCCTCNCRLLSGLLSSADSGNRYLWILYSPRIAS